MSIIDIAEHISSRVSLRSNGRDLISLHSLSPLWVETKPNSTLPDNFMCVCFSLQTRPVSILIRLSFKLLIRRVFMSVFNFWLSLVTKH